MKLNRKNAVFVLLITGILLSAAGCAPNASDSLTPDASRAAGGSGITADPNRPYISFDEWNDGDADYVSASTIYGADTFSELLGQSQCVVIATVERTYQKSDVNWTSVLKTQKVLAGETAETFELWQLKGANNLQADKTYLLLLREQETSNPELEVFYSPGNSQGVFLLDEAQCVLTAYSKKLVDADLKAWVQSNLGSAYSVQ